jgi:hypothetical protein
LSRTVLITSGLAYFQAINKLASFTLYGRTAFANNPHHRKGELIHSETITARVAQNIEDLPSLQQGDLVRVSGEVWGKDILEPLGC